MKRRHWFSREFEPGIPVEAFPDILERLRGTPLRLTERVATVTHGKRTQRPGDAWSIQEHAGHLLDLEALWLARLDDFAAGRHGLSEADLENRLTQDATHNERSLDSILQEFSTVRRGLVERLEALSPDDLTATALHPRLEQPMTVVDLMFFIAEHDDHHLAAITQLKRSL